MKSFNRQHLTLRLRSGQAFNKLFLILLLSVICYLLNVKSVSAAVTFPIPELGNCRDARECKLYCDVPFHTPACWSYEKYVLNKNILGDTTANISYPIPELGNCAGAQECFVYCNQPANQPTCLSYAQNNGLVEEESNADVNEQELLVEAAKTELGCGTKDACMTLCSDPANTDKCHSFGQKHRPDKGENRPSPQVLIKAKNDLGCENEASCANFCQNPENQNKCIEFAKKNGLMKEKDIKRMEEKTEQKKQMVEAAKTELGCESFESCGKICEDPGNREKCMNMGRKFGMIKEEIRPMGNSNTQKPTLPCTSETECKKYCQSHPDECPGMSGAPNTNVSDTAVTKPSTTSKQKGDFLGPSGCKTEDECKAYCEKHPNECPGFPKKEQPSPAAQMKPKISPSQNEKNNLRKTDGNKPPVKPTEKPQQ